MTSCSDEISSGGSANALVEIPKNFPALPIPTDNPINSAKIRLGRTLFYDTQLSLNNTISCASCHKQEFAFTDHTRIAIGINGQFGFRNTPTIANTGYSPKLAYDGASGSKTFF